MGSFNIKCAVTQLSIGYDDPVVFIPLVKADHKFSVFETEQGWDVCGEAIYGKYRDYGYVEADDEKYSKLYKKLLNDRGYFSIEDRKNNKFTVMVIHKDVYENILEAFNNGTKLFCGYSSNNVYERNFRDCEEYEKKIAEAEANPEDRIGLYMDRDFIQGYSSTIVRNPYNYEIIERDGDDFDSLDPHKFKVRYFKTVFPIVELAGDFGYPIKPNFYGCQEQQVEEIAEWKAELNNIVYQNYKEKFEEFED